jgi:hypothetical protein
MGTGICKNCGQEFEFKHKGHQRKYCYSEECARNVGNANTRTTRKRRKLGVEKRISVTTETEKPKILDTHRKGLNMSKQYNFEIGQKIKISKKIEQGEREVKSTKYATITAIYDTGIVTVRKCKLGIADIREFINMISIRLGEVRVDVV